MPKLKTNKSAAARFKVTGSGKLKRRGKGIKHLLEHLSSKVKRRRNSPMLVDKADHARMMTMLPYSHQ